MRLICRPINHIAASQRLMPIYPTRHERPTGNDREMVPGIFVLMHRKNVPNFREVKHRPRDLSKVEWLVLPHAHMTVIGALPEEIVSA